MSSFEWDAFISHASEDKKPLVVPLVNELRKYGLHIWFDAFTLKVGDSLRESIDCGLAKSEYGIVVLSHSFFAKNWPMKELSALFARHVAGKKVILPVWHDISQEELLTYSPLLADLIACKSSDGIPAVAKSLVSVIRPEAFELQTSISDSQRAFERIREQLSSKTPALDCRVTFGSELLPDLAGAGGEPGLVGSVTTDGVRMDFFAKDPSAYNQNPVSYKFGFTKEGWSKIQEGLRTGKVVTLSQDHIHGVSPEIYTSFGLDPAMFTGARSLTLQPNPELLKRRFRFRVRFTNGNDTEEFPYVEFRVIRAGTHEIELNSNGSQLPLQLTIIVHTDDTPPELGWSLSYAGHSIRRIYRAQRAFKLLRTGGSLELSDLEQDKVFAMFGQPKLTAGPDEEYLASLDRFVDNLHAVAEASKTEIIWKHQITDEDDLHTQMLHEVVFKGSVSLPVGGVDMTLDGSKFEIIQTALEQGSNGFTFRPSGSPSFGRIFGQDLNLGEYQVFVRPKEIQVSAVPDNLVHVKIIADGDVTFVFDRFKH